MASPARKIRRSRPKTARRRWLFQLLAILVGLSPLVVCEVALRIAGGGRPSELQDPYLGFTAIRPLFELNESAGRYEIAASRQEFFRPDHFAASKPADEFRVFCLGGSTVQGRPFATETSFPTWLELSLRAADPSRRWRVVNCGGVSYASYRLLPIARECLAYDPDLLVIYTGHNEFLEARTYEDVKQTPAIIAAAHSWCSYLRTYNLVRGWWMQLTGTDVRPSASKVPDEVQAMLDVQGGLEQYRRDDRWRKAVIAHFRHNLDRLLSEASEAQVPVLLVNPCSNLRSCAPFKSRLRADLDAAGRRQFNSLMEQAAAAVASDLPQAIALLEKAREIDRRHALLQFRLAQCYELAGKHARAREAYLLAKDEDICPLRMLEPMHEALAEVAATHELTPVDVRRHFESLSPNALPGESLFLDHVHPTIDGHKIIAELIFQRMEEEAVVRPLAGWRERRKRLYSENLAELMRENPVYYQRGRQRLEGLRRWTRGQAGMTFDD